MAGKLVLAVDEMAHFSPCVALLKDACVSSRHGRGPSPEQAIEREGRREEKERMDLRKI